MSFVSKISGVDIRSEKEIIKDFEQQFQIYRAKQEQLLKQSLQPQAAVVNKEQTDKAVVEFVVSKDDMVTARVKWESLDNDIADILGTLLWYVHNGSFKKECENILVSTAQQRPETMSFVKRCLEQWHKKDKSTPIINPSEVFGFGNKQGEGK